VTAETPHTPQAGIAKALTDLSDQSRVLVKSEIDSPLRETWEKARRSGPPAALAAASGALALLAAASAYRLTLRLLEERLPPAPRWRSPGPGQQPGQDADLRDAPADPEAAPRELPHAACIATAMPSRARRLATAATVCMMPPANIADGQMISGVTALPYQPACQAPSITVPIMNPNRPVIDGAAIGMRNTRLRDIHPAWSSATVSSSSFR
jgi:hypothetical protein